jgi:hypothetical protein
MDRRRFRQRDDKAMSERRITQTRQQSLNGFRTRRGQLACPPIEI